MVLNPSILQSFYYIKKVSDKRRETSTKNSKVSSNRVSVTPLVYLQDIIILLLIIILSIIV